MSTWGMTPFESPDFGVALAEATHDVRRALYQGVRRVLSRAEASHNTEQKWSAIGVVIWAFHTGLLTQQERLECVGRALELWHQLRHDPRWEQRWQRTRSFPRVFSGAHDELAFEAGQDAVPFLPDGLAEMFTDKAPPRRRR